MSNLIDICMPTDEQEGTESVVSSWLKKVGAAVTEHEPIVEINTDKVSVEVAAPASGVLVEIIAEENLQVEPGQLLGRIDTEAKASETAGATQKASPKKAKTKTAASTGSELKLSPLVRKLIEQHSIDPTQITGTGRGGRITHDDVKAYLDSSAGEAPSATSDIPSRKVKHSAIRLSIAKHMSESVKTSPHVTNLFEADLSRIVEHRNQNKQAAQDKGAKLTFTAYFVQAIVSAIKKVPDANSSWHAKELEIFEDSNIGIATSLEDKGLIVPVLKKAQDLDLFGIAAALTELTSKARDNSLEPAAVRDGTITLSNHGMTGSLLATPIIINQPQAAIIGVGKMQKRAMVVEENGKEEIKVKPMVYITMSFDHRILDGHMANNFLTEMTRFLEEYPAK